VYRGIRTRSKVVRESRILFEECFHELEEHNKTKPEWVSRYLCFPKKQSTPMKPDHTRTTNEDVLFQKMEMLEAELKWTEDAILSRKKVIEIGILFTDFGVLNCRIKKTTIRVCFG
jgi:hypothetical protein